MPRSPELEAYAMRANHPNPRMRPAVDALMSKMRAISILQDHPENVEAVINDMVHWYFMKEEKRPWYLFQLMMKINYLWGMALGYERPQDKLQLGFVLNTEEEYKLKAERDAIAGIDEDAGGG